jgi:hypothetical protein
MKCFLLAMLLTSTFCFAQDRSLLDGQAGVRPNLAYNNPVPGRANFVQFDDYVVDAAGKKFLVKDLRSSNPADFDSSMTKATEVIHAVRQNPEVLCKILMTQGSRAAWVLKRIELEPSLAARIMIEEQP